MQSNISVGISIPKEFLRNIDAKRGDISRSKFLVRMLQKAYILDEKEDWPDRRVESLQSGESSST